MTKITYMHGIPSDEWAQRGKLVQKPAYIPFASLSAGQTAVELMRQRYQVFSQFDPNPSNRKALQMLDEASRAGVHGLGGFVGVIPNELQPLARIINDSKKRTNPTTRYNIAGIGALNCRDIALAAFKRKHPGQPQYTYDDRTGRQVANPLWVNFLRSCEQVGADLEKIFNEYIPKCGHHVPYGMISAKYPNVPGRVDTRRILHIGGIEGTAAINAFPKDLMYLWYDNAIIQGNISKGVAPIGGWETSFALSGPNAQDFTEKYQKWVGRAPGNKPSPYIRGIHDPATVLAIISAIIAALKVAADFVIALRAQNAATELAIKGFGTPGFSASEDDWAGGGSGLDDQETQSNNLLLFGAAGLGLMLLLDGGKKKRK